MSRFKITKKLVKNFIEEYIEDGDKPMSQQESRLSDFFDKTSIVNEMILILKIIREITTEERLRRTIRLLLYASEEHANYWKRAKVISEDIAWSYKNVHDVICSDHF